MIEIASTLSLAELRKRYDSQLVNKALKLANSKTAQKARTKVSQLVREKYNIKASDLAKNSSIKRINGDDSDILLYYAGRRISLMYFDPREVRNVSGAAVTTYRAKNGLASRRAKRKSKNTGVSVKIRKDEGRIKVRGAKRFGDFSGSNNGAFMAQGVRGGIGGGWFRRLFNKSSAKQGRGNVQIFVRDGDERLPLSRLTGPSIPQMVGGEDVLNKALEFIGREHSIQFSHHLDKLLDGTIK